MSPSSRPSVARTKARLHSHPGHTKAKCLKIFRRLSAYLDGELPRDFCKQIRKHLGACPKCELFVRSLRLTISLCRKYKTGRLPLAAQARLKLAILRAVGRA